MGFFLWAFFSIGHFSLNIFHSDVVLLVMMVMLMIETEFSRMENLLSIEDPYACETTRPVDRKIIQLKVIKSE